MQAQKTNTTGWIEMVSNLSDKVLLVAAGYFTGNDHSHQFVKAEMLAKVVRSPHVNNFFSGCGIHSAFTITC